MVHDVATVTPSNLTLCDVSFFPALPVLCEDGDVRLIGGTGSEGVVQMCLGQRWGRICDDGWSQEDASVVCRQLGHPSQGVRHYSAHVHSCVVASYTEVFPEHPK